MKTVSDIRHEFADQLATRGPDERGMLEIPACQFVADEPAIFGVPNEDWHRRELQWYLLQSLKVSDIPPPIPKIWESVASEDGEINSNYGWCIFSPENGDQFSNALYHLSKDLYSRQALMIYTRPGMHVEFNRGGMYDFICTNQVQLLVRGGTMDYLVYMRSSDAVFGFKGDFAWHSWVFDQAVSSLAERTGEPIKRGRVIWNAGSFHIYPRHHSLVEKWRSEQ